MSAPAVAVEGLVKSFGSVRALDGLHFEVSEGAVLGLLGPNGAGKTTAIRILATLFTPDAGRASVGGYDVVARPDEVRALIGLTGQYAAVDELLSGRENLYMIGRLTGLGRQTAGSRAAELLDAFGLSEAAGKPVKTFSGGMRRRLDLAASLVGRPRVLFLDEPTTGLDPHSRRELWGLITDLVAQGTTVLLTTQYLDEADRLADSVVVVDHGRVIAEGSTAELKAKIGGQMVEVRPLNARDVPEVTTVLAELTGASDSIHRDAQLVTMPVADPALLSAAVRRLDERGVPLEHLALRRPSLDEVFLALTGHTAAGEQDENETTERSAR